MSDYILLYLSILQVLISPGIDLREMSMYSFIRYNVATSDFFLNSFRYPQ